MDGLHDIAATDGMAFRSMVDTPMQRSLRSAICCVGTGLHSGRQVQVTLRPAASGAGIVFLRTDLDKAIPARFDLVADTRLCTVLALPGQPAARVGTVEHLMAALSACGIGNVVVELDGPEVPVLDGSSAEWLFLLDCAGVVTLDVPTPVIQVVRPVRVQDGDAWAELRPSAGSGLDMAMSIEFAAPAIGRQALSLPLDEHGFRTVLGHARTFVQAHEVAGLRDAPVPAWSRAAA